MVLRSGTTWSRQSSQVANLSEELEAGLDHYAVALTDPEGNEAIIGPPWRSES